MSTSSPRHPGPGPAPTELPPPVAAVQCTTGAAGQRLVDRSHPSLPLRSHARHGRPRAARRGDRRDRLRRRGERRRRGAPRPAPGRRQRREPGESSTRATCAPACAALLQVGLMTVAFGFLIAWTSRLYRNLSALGVGPLRYTEGWAIGAWFIPFFNLVRPKQILDDIWRGSGPADGEHWRDRAVTPLAPLVVGPLDPGRRAVEVGEHRRVPTWMRPSRQRSAAWRAMCVFVVAAVVAIVAITRLTDRQERTAGRADAGRSEPVGPCRAPQPAARRGRLRPQPRRVRGRRRGGPDQQRGRQLGAGGRHVGTRRREPAHRAVDGPASRRLHRQPAARWRS